MVSSEDKVQLLSSLLQGLDSAGLFCLLVLLLVLPILIFFWVKKSFPLGGAGTTSLQCSWSQSRAGGKEKTQQNPYSWKDCKTCKDRIRSVLNNAGPDPAVSHVLL